MVVYGIVVLGEDKQILLVLDRAGWHVSQKITSYLPLGLHLEFLPPYSPECFKLTVRGIVDGV